VWAGQNKTRPLHVWDGGALPDFAAPSRRFLSVLCAARSPPSPSASRSPGYPALLAARLLVAQPPFGFEDYARDRGFPFSSESPSVTPVLGGERSSTPVPALATRGLCQQSQDFLPSTKSSTVQPALSPAIAETPQDFHRLIHRAPWTAGRCRSHPGSRSDRESGPTVAPAFTQEPPRAGNPRGGPANRVQILTQTFRAPRSVSHCPPSRRRGTACPGVNVTLVTKECCGCHVHDKREQGGGLVGGWEL
jgi:hypothetical protein